MRLHCVVGAGQSGDGIQEDDHILLVFNHPAGLFDDHFGHLHMPLGRFVERGANHFGTPTGPLHVSDLFRALIDQQNDQVAVRIVLQDGVGQFLHQHRFAGAGRGDDESAGALADRAYDIHHASAVFILGGLEQEAPIREQRSEVVEMGLFLGLVRIDPGHALDLEQGVELLLVLRWAHLSLDIIAGG